MIVEETDAQQSLPPCIPYSCMQNTFVLAPPDRGRRWKESELESIVSYLIECEASHILVDPDWTLYIMLREKFEANVRFLAEYNERMLDAPGRLPSQVRWQECRNIENNYPSVVATHMMTLLAGRNAHAHFPFVKACTSPELQPQVVGVNTTAFEALSLYPQVRFSNTIGNTFRYKSCTRSVLWRRFPFGCGQQSGIGGGLGSALYYDRRIIGQQDPKYRSRLFHIRRNPHALCCRSAQHAIGPNHTSQRSFQCSLRSTSVFEARGVLSEIGLSVGVCVPTHSCLLVNVPPTHVCLNGSFCS